MPSFPVTIEKQQALAALMKKAGIRERDLVESFVRASGPGGQKVNKTSAAVKLRHQPTGLEVRCQKTRSQALNRFHARHMLVDKVRAMILKEKSAEQKKREKLRRQKRKRSKRAKEKMLVEKKKRSEKKERRQKVLIPLLLMLLISPPTWGWQQSFVRALKNGSALVETSEGKTILDHRSREYFVPASTIKVATAACALQQLGQDFRFETEFSLTDEGELAVKGYGDPFLISEELELIAKVLAQKPIAQVTGLRLDHSYFAPNVRVDGASRSLNPYDALNGALIANFNTVFFLKKQNGEIVSAEPQTPLTPSALKVARNHRAGKERINLGADARLGARYFGELLITFLKREGVQVPPSITIAPVPDKAQLLYTHRSSKSLSDVLRGMLDFSTNFIANQLFLVMGAHRYGEPATLAKAQQNLESCLSNSIGWQEFTVKEGAGLSRQNSVTARHLMQLLRYFQPHRKLLPIKDGVFQAKTGTLRGVNTYAGYFDTKSGQQIRFVILVNDHVPHNYKFKLAHMLYKGLSSEDTLH